MTEIWRLLRTFGADQLAVSADQSECPGHPERAPQTVAHVWLEGHLADMADHFADALADRLQPADAPAPSEPLVLTRDQVAATLQVTPRTLDRWVQLGEIPGPIRVGGSTRWLREDLESWLRDRKREDA